MRLWPKQEQYFGVKRLFCLFIAIDAYDVPGANLGGCVRDSLAVEKYLREQTEQGGERLHLMCLRSPLESQADQLEVNAPTPASRELGQPTRAAIISAFNDFLSQAGEEDVVLVHYSGHGSFEKRPKELWHMDAEESSKHRAETLVCKDSFTKKEGVLVPALRDKEIRWLIAKLAKRNPHIVMLMDCCNSSGNTRFHEEGTMARYTPSDAVNERSGIKTYVFYQQDEAARAQLEADPASFHIPEGRHVALHACHSYQLAKETKFPEGRFGVFTYFLLQTLRATKGNITYRDLLKLVRNKASARVDRQSPQYHCVVPEDGDMVFLGGVSPASTEAFTVLPTETPTEGRLDGGSLHGLLGPEEGETFFTVFSAKEVIKDLTPANTRQALLTEIAPDHSKLRFLDGEAFPEDEVLLKAIVKASPLAKTKVCIELEEEEVLLVDENTPSSQRAKLAAARDRLAILLMGHKQLELTDKASGNWQYRLFVYVYEGIEKLRITEKDKVEALITPKASWANASMQALVDEMEHIAKWERTLHLNNPHPKLIYPGLVDIEVLDEKGEIVSKSGQDIVLKNAAEGTPKPQLKFKVVLREEYPAPLYCALLHIRPDFGVNPSLLAADAHLGSLEFMERKPGKKSTDRNICRFSCADKWRNQSTGFVPEV